VTRWKLSPLAIDCVTEYMWFEHRLSQMLFGTIRSASTLFFTQHIKRNISVAQNANAPTSRPGLTARASRARSTCYAGHPNASYFPGCGLGDVMVCAYVLRHKWQG